MQLLKRLAKWTPIKLRAMHIMALVGLFIAGSVIVLLPKVIEMARLRQQIRSLNQELKIAMCLTGGFPNLNNEDRVSNREISRIEKGLLDGKSILDVLTEMTEKAQHLGINVHEIAFREPELNREKQKDLDEDQFLFRRLECQKFLIDMRLECPYNTLVNYLAVLKTDISTLTELNELLIEKDEEILPHLKVNIGMTVYAMGK